MRGPAHAAPLTLISPPGSALLFDLWCGAGRAKYTKARPSRTKTVTLQILATRACRGFEGVPSGPSPSGVVSLVHLQQKHFLQWILCSSPDWTLEVLSLARSCRMDGPFMWILCAPGMRRSQMASARILLDSQQRTCQYRSVTSSLSASAARACFFVQAERISR